MADDTAVADPETDAETGMSDVGTSTGMVDGSTALPMPGRMDLDVEVTEAGPCRKHVRVVVPRDAIESAYDQAVGELAETQTVPGFRAGKVPPSLVRKKFRRELDDHVKQNVLLASLEQVSEEQELDPINEPDLDVEALDMPEDGNFEYEFDVEVRPEFDLPNYQGLKIRRPVREIEDEDVDLYFDQFLEQYGELTDAGRAASKGDVVVCEIAFTHDGKKLNTLDNVNLRVRETLKFQDAVVDDFAGLMDGAQAGDTKTSLVSISMESSRVDMRGEQVEAAFHVKEVKTLERPELDGEFLERLDVESVEELRDQMWQNLERQVTYKQRQETRAQVIESLVEAANWDLPEELVQKQTDNALRREILEMQQSGFTTDQIRQHENELRQNAISMTRRNLKEHFVLDKLADEEAIEVGDAELDQEIMMMAYQAGENPRRVRARLYKSGVIENLRAQIRERKAVDVILASADFEDVEMERPQDPTVEAVPRSVCPAGGVVADDEAESED